ncbi:hypothetical protein DWB68_15855 [Galactobacter valiniphilus]|uniref:Uncharacterized protein n=1 Tax=Galactobacter valiniphilus TaxID=2676122 RepID=A0A399JDZ0_9MICC|nr:hypothetical protein [Galactobacter valiniphilus]RII40836.1 hypothetical protein DWB68_15855 [Galactobacter valiniphilus]
MTMPLTPKIILENAEAMNKPVKAAMDGVDAALQELVEDGEEWTTNEVRAAMDMAQIGLLKAVVLGRLTPDLGHADSSTLLGNRESKGWQGRTTRTSSGSGRWTYSHPRRVRR